MLAPLRSPWRRTLSPLLYLALAGPACGYRWITAQTEPGAPLADLHLDPIDDLSAEGDLGLSAAAALREGGVPLAGSGQALGGVLAVDPERPLAYGPAAALAYAADVRFTLRLRSPDGHALWRAAPVARRATWQRGATPLETHHNRRRALHAAARAAAQAALDTWRAGADLSP